MDNQLIKKLSYECFDYFNNHEFIIKSNNIKKYKFSNYSQIIFL